ncbi:MAG: nucleotidyltransferase domain-containing protein [Candidatus Woesearchaeota archaeon]
MLNKNHLIGYALNFSSFLLDSKIGPEIRKIILFGSVARGDFNAESDIDLFVDADETLEKEVEKNLALFKSSQAGKIWRLKGIRNEISLKVGELQKWSLHREVISSGILLYGKYQEIPPNIKYYLLVNIDVSKMKNNQQMTIWRKLYGYTQKVGKKIYIGKGLIEKSGGKKLGKAIFLVPMEHRQEIMTFLNKNKVIYKINEIFSDSF